MFDTHDRPVPRKRELASTKPSKAATNPRRSLDLRRLSYFVLACQEQDFSTSAAELGVSQSAFSEALKQLSEEIGAPLMETIQRRQQPTATGLWLFLSAIPLLQAEEFFQNWIPNSAQDSPPQALVIEVKSSIAIAHLTTAVSRAAQRFCQTYPNIFPELHFTDGNTGCEKVVSLADRLDQRKPSRVSIELRPHAANPGHDLKAGVALAQVPWVTVRQRHTSEHRNSSPTPIDSIFVVPALGKILMQQARDGVGRTKAGIEFCEEPAAALPQLLKNNPSATYLIPSCLVANEKKLKNVDIRPFWPPLLTEVVAHFQDSDAPARQFVEILRDMLSEPEQKLRFRPVLSHRQMRYSRALFEKGSITAAARSLAIAQPALTEVLRKLEMEFGHRLFHRSQGGLIPTPAGRRLEHAARTIVEDVRRITMERAGTAGEEHGKLQIGIASATAYTSDMPACLARAIGIWREKFPSIRIQILQASTYSLPKMVADGTLALAISEHALPGMAKFKLADAEPLSLIVNPHFHDLPPGPVRLTDVMSLPLAVPTQEVGLRQILEAAALDRGLRFEPAIEVNSIPLTLALIWNQPICTILPLSAVRNLIDNGSLRSHIIVDPILPRQFYAFHSVERDLSKVEHEFLRLMRLEFSRADQMLMWYQLSRQASSSLSDEPEASAGG